MRIFAIIFSLFATPSLGSVRGIPDLTRRCEIAYDVIADLTKQKSERPIIFTEEPELLLRPLQQGRWADQKDGTKLITPPIDLLKRFDSGDHPSAVKVCANVRAYLNQKGIRYGHAAEKRATAGRGPERNYRARIESVSLPTITPDGSEAVLIGSSVSGPMAAGGYARYLRRNAAGRWTEVGYKGLWVS